MRAREQTPRFRILGDAPNRSYAAKLARFECFAAPELSRIFAGLTLPRRGTALDLGCGTGLASRMLADALGPDVLLVGLDLSLPHLQAARGHLRLLVQGDAEQLCFPPRSFDLIYSCNTINHVTDRTAVLRSLRRCLKADARLVLAQSGFLPEMFFAWDAHLDDAVRVACHRYYRERYGLEPEDTADLRALKQVLLGAGFDGIEVRTHLIERTQPLSATDRDYFQRVVFEGMWGERLKPYLSAEHWARLERWVTPGSRHYCLDRADFHHLQTLTVCVARRAA